MARAKRDAEMRGVRLLSCCRTDVFDDCAVPRLFVDIVKLPLKPPPLCVAWLDEADAVLKAIPPPDHTGLGAASI